MRPMEFGDLWFCGACGGHEQLRSSPWHAPQILCSPCFLIWYDDGITDPVALGTESRRRKKANVYPWRKAA